MSESSTYTEVIARFYDVIYATVRAGYDTSYFISKMKSAPGPVLEVGVGTGRFFTEALKAQADIYGIDNSPEMLAQLKNKIDPSEHFRISQQDVTSFSLDKKFVLIIAPFRVFAHLLSVEQQLAALDRIYDHLLPDGIFIFDLYIPDLKMLLNGLDNFQDFEGEYKPGHTVKRIVSSKSDLVSQINQVTMRFVWDEDNGEEKENEWSFDMRFFWHYELEHLIKRSRLELVAIFGDYNENPLGPKSKDFVVKCRRPA
jgi:SAM-dependent methyltransferase